MSSLWPEYIYSTNLKNLFWKYMQLPIIRHLHSCSCMSGQPVSSHDSAHHARPLWMNCCTTNCFVKGNTKHTAPHPSCVSLCLSLSLQSYFRYNELSQPLLAFRSKTSVSCNFSQLILGVVEALVYKMFYKKLLLKLTEIKWNINWFRSKLCCCSKVAAVTHLK